MTIAPKLVWAEGISLSQQHFQQWDRYHDQQRFFWINCAIPHLWGVCQLVIDKELLATGSLSINQCQLIFPNGLMVNYDAATNSPLSFQLKQTNQQQIDIYICMPLGNAISQVSAYPQSAGVPTWQAAYQVVTDIYDGNREHEVLFAHPNLLLLDGESSREHYHAIKIVEVMRSGADFFQLNEEYIPPLVHLAASQSLQRGCKRSIELLHEKIHFLSERLLQIVHDTEQDSIKHLMLLQQLNEMLAILRYYCHIANIHPQQIYQCYLKMMSRLCAFSHQHKVTELPLYHHVQLTDTFRQLEQYLYELLEIAMPSQMTTLTLQRISNHLYAVDKMEAQWLEKNSFYLAVKFESADPQWMSQWIRQTKIGARPHIETIVASALSGVKIQYAQRLPNKLMVKAGYEYFYIEPSGEFWQKIIAEASLALFIADDFMSATIELVMVRS